jgi:heat shock protein HtpX
MFKRVALFIITNVLVIATISIVTSLLGLDRYLTANGINYTSLAFFCAIWGTAGAFIALFASKWIAKTSMRLNMINPQQATGVERDLLNIVYDLAHKVGLVTMPEVGIYDSPELNAFATGPSKKNALVAVSSGLLQNMDSQEVSAVLGHEISHVANGDMVTMTLVQGIINAFALFLSRILAYTLSIAVNRGENDREATPGMLYMGLAMVSDIVFTLLGSIVVAAFSRRREYRADRGGAKLVGKIPMIEALRRLQSTDRIEDNRAPSLSTLKISHRSSWFSLFSSHPPLEKRIERLQQI